MSDRTAALSSLVRGQAGVVSRSQVMRHGFTDAWLQHQVRAGRWRRVHAGVYATFTGMLPWESQCWAALLRCAGRFEGRSGVALAGPSALRLWEPCLPAMVDLARPGDVVIAVDESRRVAGGDGVDVWRVTDLERHVHPVRRPPVLRFDAAVLLTASRLTKADAAIGAIAAACQSRRTTPVRLLALMDELPGNLRLRSVLRDVLSDVATGAYSYLEVHYLRDVERPHGLPVAARQRRVVPRSKPYFRDVEYLGYGVVAELDGRLGHEDFWARADDMDRDTDAAASVRTARIGYVQVMSRRCATAQRVIDLLRSAGWTGQPRRCESDCPVR